MAEKRKPYWEQLKDPRWQRKRLEVLEREGFRCQMCHDDGVTLHVHHLTYARGKAPWDYHLSNFAVLCEDCHADWHEVKEELDSLVAQITMSGRPTRLLGYVSAMVMEIVAKKEPRADYLEMTSVEETKGAADYFGLTGEIVRHQAERWEKELAAGGCEPIEGPYWGVPTSILRSLDPRGNDA